MTEEFTNDHDLLIELRTEMRGLRADVNKFNNDVMTRIADLEKYKLDVDVYREKNKDIFDTVGDHEIRIRATESNITRILTWGSATLVILGVVQFIVGKYF